MSFEVSSGERIYGELIDILAPGVGQIRGHPIKSGKIPRFSVGYHPCRGFGVCESRNRIRAGCPPLALLAELAEIQLVDPVHQLAEMGRIIGEHARLEVALVLALRSQSRAGQIGRADEGLFAINHHRLGVDARAEDAFKKIAIDQVRVSVEVLAEARSGFLGMHQANGDPAMDQIRQDFQQGHKTPVLGNMQVLDVGRDDPEEFPRLRQKFDNHAAVDGFIEEEFHGFVW